MYIPLSKNTNHLSLKYTMPEIHLLGTEDDLEYFILHCGEVCGIAQKLPQSQRTARNILELTLMELVEFKKLNSVSPFNLFC